MNVEKNTIFLPMGALHVHMKEYPMVIKPNEMGSKGQCSLAGFGAESR